VAGLRTRALTFNAAVVDATDAESAGRWRELLAGGGIKRASVSGSGIFKDQASDARIRELFFAGTIRAWRLILPDFGTVEGPFQITALEFSADHAGEVTFEIALESAGELGFTVL
jgi:TP901-1 family phage major tail protein